MASPLSTLVIALVALATPASAQAPAPDTTAQGGAANGVLQPGDIVRLEIWREPDLSGDFPVDSDGIVVFPKIGARTVVDRSPRSLEEGLVEEYQVYLRNPSINVVLLRRVRILGEVREPGLHPVDPTMTLADVLAVAGGMTPNGDSNRIQLIRDGETMVTRLDEQTRLAEIPIRSGDQIYVPERSWIMRNLATTLSVGVSLFIALFVR